MINYFIFDGKNSLDYGVYISGNGTFGSPKRVYEEVEVDGHNGVLLIDKERYENIEVTYEGSFILKDFGRNMASLRGMLNSSYGYCRLEDTYHPEEYRMACFSEDIDPTTYIDFKAGTFDITFNCKPQRFLKSGEIQIERASGTKIVNPTFFTAKPLIRVYGTGTVTVGNKTFTISEADEYTDIDSDICDCYKETTNCNGNVSFGTSGDYTFPTLPPGETGITYDGPTKVLITPRWWTL